MNDKRLKNMFLLTSAGTLLMLPGNTSAKDAYCMDSSRDCSYIGLQDVPRDQAVMVHAKTTDISSSTQLECTIDFQAVDNDATIIIDFESFIVNNCDVKLYISGDSSGSMSSYSCGDDQSMYASIGRTVTLTLHRTKVTATTEYSFRLKLTAARGPGSMAVGLGIGIVGPVFVSFLFFICLGNVKIEREYHLRHVNSICFGASEDNLL